LQNQSKDRIAARIPISGTVSNPQTGVWAALGSALRNAFIEGLPAELEASVGEK
jgi:hypothetical protein